MELIELSEKDFQPSTITLAGNFNISVNINNLALWMPIKIIYNESGKRQYLLSGSRQSISYFGSEGDIVSICYKKIRRGMRTGAMNNMISADIQYNKKNIHLKISSSSITSVGTSSYENGQAVFRLMTEHIRKLKNKLDIINNIDQSDKLKDLLWLKKNIFTNNYDCKSLASLILKEKNDNPFLLFCALFIEDEEKNHNSDKITIKLESENGQKEYDNLLHFTKDMEQNQYYLIKVACEYKYQDNYGGIYEGIHRDYKNIIDLDKYKILSFYCTITYKLAEKEYYYETMEQVVKLHNYDDIISMHANNCNLSTLPEILPKNLKELYISNNNLTELPNLPESLKILRAYNNQIKNINMFNDGLQEVWLFNNQLTNLPILPESLKILDIDNNQISNLPNKPNSLVFLSSFNNNMINDITLNHYEKILNNDNQEDKLMRYYQKMNKLLEPVYIYEGNLNCDNFVIYNSVYHITPVKNKNFRMPLHRLAPFLASKGVAVEYHNWTSEGVNICFDTEEKRDRDSHKEYKHRFSIHETTKIRQCSPTNKKEAYINYKGVIELLKEFFATPNVDFNRYICEKLEDKKIKKDLYLVNKN